MNSRLEAGSNFGEIALFYGTAQRTCTVVSIDFTTLAMLS